MRYDAVRARDLLKLGTGNHDAEFRDGQEEAIRHLVEGRARQLLVQKTGWGKSFVYFIATRLLREAGLGPTLLISPLLALMRNQIAAAERMGVRAETINSDNEEEWDRVENAARVGELDILLISNCYLKKLAADGALERLPGSDRYRAVGATQSTLLFPTPASAEDQASTPSRIP